jgi:WD40 repeat protein
MRLLPGFFGLILLAVSQPQGEETSNPNGNTQVANGPMMSRAVATFSPDSKWLLTEFTGGRNGRYPADWKKITLWQVATGKPVKTFPVELYGGDASAFLSFLPDGKHALSGGPGHWLVFEVPSGKLVRASHGTTWNSHPLDLSRDGKRLLCSGSTDEGQGLQIWNVDTGKAIDTYETTYPISDGKLSANGEMALAGGGPQGVTLQLWNLLLGTPSLALRREGTKWWCHPFSFSPDESQFIVTQADRDATHLYLYDIKRGKAVRRLPGQWPDCMHNIAFTPDGNDLLVAAGHRLQRLALRDGKQVWSVDLTPALPLRERRYPHSVVFSRNVSVAFVADGTLASALPMRFTLWDIVRGAQMHELDIESLNWAL